MSPISKSLWRRKSGPGKSHWLCAPAAGACLVDKALLCLHCAIISSNYCSLAPLQVPPSHTSVVCKK